MVYEMSNQEIPDFETYELANFVKISKEPVVYVQPSVPKNGSELQVEDLAGLVEDFGLTVYLGYNPQFL